MGNIVDNETKNMKYIREYISLKYGDAYISAMAKICAQNIYDESGILKKEYVLTSEEKDALHLYISGLDKQKDKDDLQFYISLSRSFDERYEEFLDDVKNKTIGVVINKTREEAKDIILWNIIGVEFTCWEIEKKYGKDVYQKACEEVPYESDGIHRIYERDFSHAHIKLGHLVHEGVSASPLLDLDLFMKLLEKKGIPTYVDYEKNIFYYNAQLEVEKTTKEKEASLGKKTLK